MPNSLIHQTSPYLLQHANNPVDWHPWDEEALELAKKESKPILLSIGYAACHWCHVMEAESFENEQIASIMNANFICIKVDREERPDLDKIYQLAHQMLTQRPGGWPLTIALTPDGHAPFFAGTYFPAQAKFNMPGFGELLLRISAHYTQNREKLGDYHLSFHRALEKLNPSGETSAKLSPHAALAQGVEALKRQFDDTFGGFGDAPKFPHPTQLELLMAAGQSDDAGPDALAMAEKTLTRIAEGGLFDHLFGGFFRYSVDREWKIPHFEKMLYDNAQLMGVYSSGYQLFSNPLYKKAAIATADWVIAEMQQKHGGYASTLDADSEGEEGKYYVWSETDLRAVLREQEYTLLENYFGLHGEPNFEGKWHFNISPETDYAPLDENPEIKERVENAISKLFHLRQRRIRPGLDGKILTGWNGLMIAAMAQAGRVFGHASFFESAQKSVDFIKSNLWKNSRLQVTYSKGRPHLNGYLDDYAFLLGGIMNLLQGRWREADLDFAIEIADGMIEHFEDVKSGGFYFTSHDHEKLLYRPKSGADDAIPSGNGVAISSLISLGRLLAENKYLETAERALQQFSDELRRHPSVNASMSIALQKLSGSYTTVIIRGDKKSIESWLGFLNQTYFPTAQFYGIESKTKNLHPALAVRKPQSETVAYICRGTRCTPPIASLQALAGELTR